MRSDWSEGQEELLKKVWFGKGSIKASLDLFEGRSYIAVVSHAHQMKLGRRPHPAKGNAAFVWDEIVRAYTGKTATTHEISKKLRLSHTAVVNYLNLRDAGPAGRCHVADWERKPQGGPFTPIYALGPGINAAKPSNKTPEQIKAQKRDYHRRRLVANGGLPRHNPFAAVAGLVAIPQGQTGRVFQQPMTVKDDEPMEQAA
jgi:hypothetical protein